MKSFIIHAAAAAFVAIPSVALAGTINDAPLRREVGYAGLDLRSQDGIAMLNGRILRAVHSFCGRGFGITLDERMAVRKCETQARQSAQRQVELAIAKVRTEHYAGDPARVAVIASNREGL